MADQTAIKAQHATLSSTTADKITFSGRGDWINVLNHSTTNLLTVVIGGTTAPTALQDDSYVVPTNGSLLVPYVGGAPLVVHVVGDGNQYSVQLI